MSNLYGLLIANEKQEEPIKSHCFGDCGKISVSGAEFTPMGPVMMCTHDDCPYLVTQTDMPIGESGLTGEPVYLRVIE